MLCGPGGEWKDAVRLHEDSNFIRFYIKRALRSRFSSDFGCDFDTVFDSDDGRKYWTETILALILLLLYYGRDFKAETKYKKMILPKTTTTQHRKRNYTIENMSHM
jgi:hypothetical protein